MEGLTNWNSCTLNLLPIGANGNFNGDKTSLHSRLTEENSFKIVPKSETQYEERVLAGRISTYAQNPEHLRLSLGFAFQRFQESRSGEAMKSCQGGTCWMLHKEVCATRSGGAPQNTQWVSARVLELRIRRFDACKLLLIFNPDYGRANTPLGIDVTITILDSGSDLCKL